jgi:hypothetical protein
MKKFLAISLIAVIAVFASISMAAAAPNQVNVTANVPNTFSVSLDKTAVAFNFTTADVTAGTRINGDTPVVLNVKSNKLFDVSQATSDFVGSSTSAVIPASRMHYSITGDNTKTDTAFATASTALFTGESRGNRSYTNTYNMAVTLADPADTYGTTVTYTVVQQ